MFKNKVLSILGIVLALIPYSGFPLGLKNIIISLLGISVIFISYLFYKERKTDQNSSKTSETHSENSPAMESEIRFPDDSK